MLCQFLLYSIATSHTYIDILFFSFFFFFVFFPFLGPLPTAYGGSQARGLIRAEAAGLLHSQSNTRSEPHL